ncbi:MAG: Gfo/Idh/MocA family oxidoreductase [Pirellulales bacterium]
MSQSAISRVRVAVVGYGSIGRRHFDNLGRLGVSRRVVVRRPHGANAAFTPPPGARVVHSHREALAEGLDLAIIANPTRLHVAAALEYAEAGVAVLVEKPLAAELSECGRLVELASHSDVPIGMAYCLRYHPAYAAACARIAQGSIGRLLYGKAWFEDYLPDWHPWEDYRDGYAARADLGGGVLPTLDHELDFLNWCLGAPASATGCTLRSGALDTDVPDLAMLAVRYPGGVTADAVLSLCRRDRTRGFEFVGSEATLHFRFETGRLELAAGPGRPPEPIWHDPAYDLNRMYLDMLADFLEHVVSRRPPPVPLAAGIDSLRLIEMAERGWRLEAGGQKAEGRRQKFRRRRTCSTGRSEERVDQII